MNKLISRQLIPAEQRMRHTAKLFGVHFPLVLEPFIYATTEKMTRDYTGGYWHFYALSNGGFYMAPDDDRPFHVGCDNYSPNPAGQTPNTKNIMLNVLFFAGKPAEPG